jgi:hypothetical protein
MAKDKISDYSSTANSNTDIAGINIDEGCAPSGINDAIRTLMAQLKTWQSGGQDVYIHPAGSASAPSITANGDTNTGIFFPAADTVGITTGGTERARVDSSGNVGIGTSSPSNRLSVVSASGSDGFISISSPTTDTAGFSVNGGTDSNKGAIVRFQKGASTKWTMGTDSAIIGGTSDNFHLYSGGANAILFSTNASERMRLDANGSLLVGETSSPSSTYRGFFKGSNASSDVTVGVRNTDSSGYSRFVLGNNAGVARFTIGYTGSGSSTYSFGASAAWLGTEAAEPLVFQTNGTERARIDSSGNFMVGTTTIPAWGDTTGFGFGYDLPNKTVHFKNNVSTSNALTYFNATSYTSGTGYFAQFRVNGSTVGNITTNGSTTTYATSSDYRLKENIAPMTGALATVAQLKPCTYTWKADGSASQGFIAHELQEIVPDAVVGEKDDVNEDGSIKPQGIDTSFLVATLTAAIKELKAEFDAYKASHP